MSILKMSATTALGMGLVITFTQTPAKALNFNFVAPDGIDPLALQGFEDAGDIWSKLYEDDITINININFAPLAPGIIGGTRIELEGFLYQDIENALIADQTSRVDDTAVANLPGRDLGGGLKSITFLTTEQTADNFNLELDPFATSTITADNVALAVPRANAKALSLLGDDGSTDATITFSSDFKFDFNRSNGIDAQAFDFVGVATHEIGHALGFFSGVDFVDRFTGNGDLVSSDLDLDDFAVFSLLDLYRYSDLSVSLGNALDLPVLDLAADIRDKYFSLDGGRTNLGLFSTGRFNGDGFQASHWKNNLGLGLMDPTAARGELLKLSSLDVRAFDAIGYDLASVPEPRTIIGLLTIVTGLFGFCRTK